MLIPDSLATRIIETLLVTTHGALDALGEADSRSVAFETERDELKSELADLQSANAEAAGLREDIEQLELQVAAREATIAELRRDLDMAKEHNRGNISTIEEQLRTISALRRDLETLKSYTSTLHPFGATTEVSR